MARTTHRTRSCAALLAGSVLGGLLVVAPADAARPDLDRAVSVTHEDSYYPRVGDPGVDALHYRLGLAWQPDTLTLTGDETLTFRATRTAPRFRLDLSPTLTVSSVTLAGQPVTWTHPGKDLVVAGAVTRGRRYVVRIAYAGVPRPVPAPTTRKDVEDVGLTPTDDGGAWTIQEPFGAFTWYAVNDQPADKALYDFELGVPAPMTGIANGRLTSSRLVDGIRLTRWRLRDPASSYVTTLAFGRYRLSHARSRSGVPFTFAVPPGKRALARRLGEAVAGLGWLEQRLGPFPFEALGAVIVPSDSAEETQAMMTIGDELYDSRADVLLHEMAHQWYGDLVTPRDWRDLWMNEGMATYLEALWGVEHMPGRYGTREDTMARYAQKDRAARRLYGPPAAYDERAFASNNVYYGPALMWDQLRKRIGDEEFFRITRLWPRVHAYGNSDRVSYTRWIGRQTHRDLRGFFRGWLLGKKQPRLR